jgi:hypothetical protein
MRVRSGATYEGLWRSARSKRLDGVDEYDEYPVKRRKLAERSDCDSARSSERKESSSKGSRRGWRFR